MPAKQYIVKLEAHERERLEGMIRGGESSARKVKRAMALVKSDDGDTDQEIADAVMCHRTTIERLRIRFTEEGLEDALSERPRPGQTPRLDAAGRSMLAAVACTTAPESHWTSQMMADELVRQGAVERISAETVRRELKKTNSSRGNSSSGA